MYKVYKFYKYPKNISEVPHDKKHSIEHGLHTTSIAILALFVAEVIHLSYFGEVTLEQ